MLVLTVLALAMAAEGYRLDSSPPSPMGVNMIREMCQENGANYTAVENAATQFISCMEVDFEVKMFERELKEALMYHTYDLFNRVFKKYCRKTPELKACYHKLVEAVAPCFGSDKQALVTISENMNDQILNFACENDGSIMTKFIMEGGPQCFQAKTYDIMMCTEMSKSSILNMEQSSALSATASFRVYDDLLKCVLQSIETCHNPISTRIVRRIGEIVKQSISEELINTTAQVPTPTEGVWRESTTTTERGWYKPTTSTERYWYRPTTSTERHWYRPTTSTKRYWYRPTTSTERYWYRPTTSTERHWYRPTTSTERYWYRPITSTERYGYKPTTSTERYWYKPTTSTEGYWYRPTTSTERYWYRPTTSTERYWYRPTTSTERHWYRPTTSTERYWYRPATSTERYWYRPTTLTERYWYRPTTSTERYWYRPITSTERYVYKPTTSTERYWYKPTTSTEGYRYRPTTSTERYWYRPTTSTERYWYRPTTSTERYWYKPTTSTERYWYKPTTTTEQIWNHVNTAWQNEKGAPTNGGNNLQVQCSDQDTKNITCNPLRKLLKASGTINVAFNADIYI